MPDVFTQEKRSEVMSKIRGRRVSWVSPTRSGRRTARLSRRNQAVFGRPDFVFPKIKLAVFVDGCFWHACPSHSNMPVQNRKFWKAKLVPIAGVTG
jgi:DNA mismatch endonuclease (patch repair protein)